MKRNSAVNKYNALIIDQVRDVEGGLWDVREIRDTKFGFNLIFGSPESRRGNCKPRLIATQELYDHWEANKERYGEGLLYSLPAGRSTLKRVRRRLGFNCMEDMLEFWVERIDDLATLTPRQFAARHKVTWLRVFDWRRKLLGSEVREPNWWMEREAIDVLLAGKTLKETGRVLGISTSHVFRLRARAMELRQSEDVLLAA